MEHSVIHHHSLANRLTALYKFHRLRSCDERVLEDQPAQRRIGGNNDPDPRGTNAVPERAGRSKNAASAGLRSMLDLCVVVLAVWAYGIAIFVGDWRNLLGHKVGLVTPPLPLAMLTWQMTMLAAIATMIPLAAGFGRIRFAASLVVPAVLGGVVVPVCMRFANYTLVSKIGFRDDAGTSYLHVAGAVWGLVAVIAVGCAGKRNTDGSSNMIPAHNAPLASVGAMLILAGFLPYIMLYDTHPVSDALENLLLSAAAAAVVGTIFTAIKYGLPDYHVIFTALLGGLVAMTAAPADLPGYGAILTGIAAGLIVPWLAILFDLKFKLDDPVSAIVDSRRGWRDCAAVGRTADSAGKVRGSPDADLAPGDGVVCRWRPGLGRGGANVCPLESHHRTAC